MRISISRIALLSSLLAGALPLSAKDDVDQPHAPHSTTTATAAAEEETIISSLGQQEPLNEKDEETQEILNEEGESSLDDEVTTAAAEAVHDDGKLYTIPPIPAELLDLANTTPPYTGESSGENEEEETRKAQHEDALQDTKDGRQEDSDDTIRRAEDDVGESEITTNASMSRQQEGSRSQEHQIDINDHESGDAADAADSLTSQTQSSSQERHDANEDETKNESQSPPRTTETIQEKDETIRTDEQQEQEETQRQQQGKDDDSQADPQESTLDSVPSEKETEEITKTDASSSSVTEEKKKDSKDDDEDDGNEEEEDGRARRVQVDYANKASGALILEKSSSMKGASNLLLNDNDRYAISPCSDKGKYVIVGLSEDILVKTIKMANYERYSSPPKKFQVLGSSDMITFVDMGEFVAHSGNGEQAFELKEPAWARYLKFRFLTHYGAEHYCTVSQIKVHGSTMTQGFQEQFLADSVKGEQEHEQEPEEKESKNDVEEVGGASDPLRGNDSHDDVNIAKQPDNDSSTENVSHQKDKEGKDEATVINEQGENERVAPTSSNIAKPAVDETVKTDSDSAKDNAKGKDADMIDKDASAVRKKNENSSISGDGEECSDQEASTPQNNDPSDADEEEEATKRANTSAVDGDSPGSSDSATISTTVSSWNRYSEIPHEVTELASLVVNLGAISSDKGRSVGVDEEVVPEGGWQRTTPQSSPDGEVQNTALSPSSSPPTPLTPDAFDDDTETGILSSASIGTSSSAKTSSAEEGEATVDSERGSATVSMKDASYAVKNVIQTVRQSASSTTVASAVKELQNIILTKIGSSVADGGDVSVLTRIDNKDTASGEQMKNRESAPIMNDVDAVYETKHAAQSSGSMISERTDLRATEAQGSPKTAPRHAGGAAYTLDEESKLGTSTTSGVHDSGPLKNQQSQSADTPRSPHQNRGVDETSSTRKYPKPSDGSAPSQSVMDTFAILSKKFPSMACLNGLDYQAFRAKASKSVGGSGSYGSTGGAGVGGAGGGPPNRIEPIFKTLTDEIKSLQNTQSAHEQYVGALQGCYQQIVLDMARHIETVESSQEDRLAKLEEALHHLQKQQNAQWIQQAQQYASHIYDVGSAATKKAIPILLATIRLCYTYGQMFFLLVEDFISVAVLSLLDWLLRVVENEEIKVWLEWVAAMDKGTARQTAMFCYLIFWLVLTQIRLCRVQRRTKTKSLSLGRGEEVEVVHLHSKDINTGASCARVDGQAKTHQGDVHSHNIHDDMSCSDLSEGETPVELSPSA